MVEVRGEFEGPGEAEKQVEQHGEVIGRWCIGQSETGTQVCVNEQALLLPKLLPLLDAAGRGKDLQVPVLGDVPVEAVARIDQHAEQPETVVGRGSRGAALQSGKDDDGKGRRVLQGVGEVLAAPARDG